MKPQPARPVVSPTVRAMRLSRITAVNISAAE